MNKVAKFEKVSLSQFMKDWVDAQGNKPEHIITEIYNNIKLPKRATKGSAGYDFFSPIEFVLHPGESINIPTGIRCEIENGWVLMIYPRSSVAIKKRLVLDNHTGIIDSDYYYSDNEGHIFLKLSNDSNDEKVIHVKKGDRIVQGIFVEYGITYDDVTDGVRNGGFGSTN